MTNPLYDALFTRHRGNRKAFLELANGSSISFGEFVDMADRIATVLMDRGVVPGDRVAVQAPKSPDVLALYAACLQVGAVFLPLNTAYTPVEVEYFLTDSTPRLFVSSVGTGASYQALCRRLGVDLLTLGDAQDGTLVEARTAAVASMSVVDRGPEDLAAILYTSGTTGRSKGAMLTHENLLSNAVALVDTWRFGADDVLIHALPVFHTHGLFVATNVMLLVGGTMIFQVGFDVDAVLDAIPRASALMGVPTFYTRLLTSERLTHARVGNMRLFVSGSAPLLAETHREFEARTGHRILERYGMTETSMTTSNPYDRERRAGTVGFPLPQISVRVTDKDGNILPNGEIGGLEVKGPNVFKGYWQLPEKTAAEFRPDGYFITGDMVSIDEDGYVQIVGREKDLIISGGLNIYPKEIETEIDSVPGIVESAVFGVPHPDFGEAAVAVIVAGEGFDVDAVKRALESRLARFKHPRCYELAAELPRNAMGKVQKAQLRAQFRDVFGE